MKFQKSLQGFWESLRRSRDLFKHSKGLLGVLVVIKNVLYVIYEVTVFT